MKAASIILLGAALLAMPALVNAQEAPTELRSASDLSEDAKGRDSWTYRNPNADLTKYKAFIIEPTVVYSGPTATWSGTTPAQRATFAERLTRDLRDEMAKSYTLAKEPGPDVATMRLTLLGVSTTTPVVATAARVTPVGLALHGVKSIAGKPGAYTGSAQIALEVTDSRSDELLAAAIRRRSPDALNISATLSTEATVAAVSKDIASAIRKAVDTATGR